MSTTGPWIMLGVGVLVCLAIVYAVVVGGQHVKDCVWALVIGAALCGVGVYGLAFLDPFTRLIRTLPGANASQTVREKAMQNALTTIANGRLLPQERRVLMPYLLSQPLPNMTNLLRGSIQKATSADAKKTLELALQSYEAKRVVATNLALAVAQGRLRYDVITNLDMETRTSLAESLKRIPTNQIHGLVLDADTLRALHDPKILVHSP
ncbi:MAG: hypothetical protein ACYDH9_19170 [Limisphaerales bacterium]